MHFALVQHALLGRLLVGILVVGGALLIHPRTIMAQSNTATPFPLDGLAPEVVLSVAAREIDPWQARLLT